MSKFDFTGMTRRDVAKAFASVGVGIAMMPMGGRSARAAGEVHYHTWAGYDSEPLFAQYVAKYGGLPEFSYVGAEEESLQKIRAGYAPDLMHPGSYSVIRWKDAGFLRPMDPSRLANWPDVFDSLKNLNMANIDGDQYYIPSEFGNSSIVYRTDLVDAKYQGDGESWGIFYDEDYARRVAFYDSANAVCEITALMLGYDNIFSLTDDQLVEVKKLATKQRDMLRFYWTDVTQVEQALASGEIVAAYAWNQSLVTLKEQGLPVAMAVPKEGIFTWVGGFVMHKDVKDEQAAYDLIDSWTSPESGAWLIDNFGYGSSNRKAYDIVPKPRLEELGFAKPEDMLNGSIFYEALEPGIDEKYNKLLLEVQAGS
jgi:spermidine/putrescine-binding protein